MYRLSPQNIEAVGSSQTEELEKIALNILKPLGAVARQAGKSIRSGGRVAETGARTGNIVGALGGTAIGAATGAGLDEENRLRGAILGGLGGAALGAGAGQVATRAGRGELKQFGQRQLHGATGYLPGKGFTATHKMDPKERVAALKEMGWTLPEAHAKDTGQAVKNLKAKIRADRDASEGLIPGIGSLRKRFAETGVGKKWEDSRVRELLLKKRIMEDRANLDLAEQGLTSFPGAIRGYVMGQGGNPQNLTRLQQLKANLVAPGLALGVGLPAVSLGASAYDLAQNKDPKQFGKDLADTAGFSAFTGLPILPALAVGEGASRLAGYALGTGQQPPDNQQQLPSGQRVRISQGAGDFMAHNLDRIPR